MSVSTLPTPTAPVKVSPIVSQAEILAKVAAGTMTVEAAAPLLESLIPARTPTVARVTPKDSRPYRKTRNDKGIEKLYLRWEKPKKGSGAMGAFTTTPEDWALLEQAVQGGAISRMLNDHQAGTVQWSESYAQKHPEVLRGGAA